MRYADDFLVLMRQWDERVQNWIENSLEGKFELTINREKTKVVDLNEEQAKVNFLGCTFQTAPGYPRSAIEWRKWPRCRVSPPLTDSCFS